MKTASVWYILFCSIPIIAARAQPPAKPDSPRPAGPAAQPTTQPATAPATQPGPAEPEPDFQGAISIRAVQGTKDAPVPAGDKVILELTFGDGLVRAIEGTLDKNGVWLLDGLPLDLPFTPRAIVHHAGLEYPVQGGAMDMAQPVQKLKVDVFETTPTEPPWHVQMWAIQVGSTPHGPVLTQNLMIQNLSDRVWLGMLQDDGSHVSLVFPLPPECAPKSVFPGQGFVPGQTRLVAGGLEHTAPLWPGSQLYSAQCLLGKKDGQARVELVAPAGVDQLAVILPPDSTQLASDQLQAGKSSHMGRIYRMAEVHRGQKVTFTLSGMPEMSGSGPAGSEADKPASSAKIVAMVGGGVILAIALVVAFLKPKKGAAAGGPGGSGVP